MPETQRNEITEKHICLLRDFKDGKIYNKIYNKNSEFLGLMLFGISAIIYGIGAFQIKFMKNLFPDAYDGFLVCLYRSISMMGVSYMIIRYKKIEIIKLEQIENKFWLAVRTLGQFFSFVSYIFCLEYIRVGTAQSITAMHPALIVILSTFILKEKFYMRYIYGICICFLGTLLIISNDRNNKTEIDSESNSNLFRILIGVFWAVVNLINIAMLSISSKILMQEKIGFEIQVYYIGLSNIFLSSFPFIYRNLPVLSFPFFIMSLFNGVLFIIATLLLIESLKLVELNKTSPLAFLGTLAVFILGVFFLDEAIYFTDLIGVFIIVGYNVINSLYPIRDL